MNTETVPLAGDSAAAVRADRERCTAILELGTRHNKRQLADKAIAEGVSLEAFRGALLDHVAQPAVADTAAELGLSKREAQAFSIRKAILAQLDAAQYGRAAGLEIEASRALANRYGREPRGLFIPADVLRRDLSVGTSSAGGYLRPTQHIGSEFVAPALATPVIVAAGARVLSGLTGNVAIPRMTTGSTVSWTSAEAGALSETNPVFSQLTLQPHDLGCYVDVTRRLMQQGDPSVEQIIRDDFAAQLANAVDAAAISGSGTNGQPVGILQTSGINSVSIGTNGGAPTYATLAAMLKQNGIDNTLTPDSAWLINAATMAKLMTTPKQSSGVEGAFILTPDAAATADQRLMGYRLHVSNNVPGNLTKGSGSSLSAILFGRPQDVVLGYWGGVEVLVDPFTHSSTGTVRLRVFQTVDVGLRNPSAWCACSDVVTA